MSAPVVADPVRLGQTLAASGYFGDAREAAQAAVKVMAGQELGFGPVASMTGIHIIEGKPSLGANLLAALIKRSSQYSYRVVELTDERCEIAFFERQGDEWVELEPHSEFTIKDAERADLLGRKNWRQYPRNMLFARAISNGITFHCPDLTGGAPIYTPDELGVDEPVEALTTGNGTTDVNGSGDSTPPTPPPPPSPSQPTPDQPAPPPPSGTIVATEKQQRMLWAVAEGKSGRGLKHEEAAAILLHHVGVNDYSHVPKDKVDVARKALMEAPVPGLEKPSDIPVPDAGPSEDPVDDATDLPW